MWENLLRWSDDKLDDELVTFYVQKKGHIFRWFVYNKQNRKKRRETKIMNHVPHKTKWDRKLRPSQCHSGMNLITWKYA